MKFYNKHYESNYEELITYYPRYYRDVFEMVEILKALGKATDTLEGHIEQTYLNHFIMSADADTVKRWEKMLQITDVSGLSLEQRKCVILGRLCGGGHIGEPEMRVIISNYTSNPVTVDFANGVITVVIDGEIFGEDNLLDTLLRCIPAHLALKMSIHVQRTFREKLNLCFGGHLTAEVQGVPPAVKHASARREDGAGGVYYYTHTKSKLIG